VLLPATSSTGISSAQKPPADQDAAQRQKRFMDVGTFFVADTPATRLIQPGEGPFNDPPPSAQSAVMFGVALSEPRHDVARTQTLPDCLRVIATVGKRHMKNATSSKSCR
jgi:hypothetical protein